jgi:Txe/YoeB family toxin of Txe-Axe toxin-antitoxin module
VYSEKSKKEAYHKMYLALRGLTKRLLSLRGIYFGEVKAGLDERYNLDINNKNLANKIIDLYEKGLIDEGKLDELLKLERNHLKNKESHDLLEEEIKELKIVRWTKEEVEKGYKILRGGLKLTLLNAIKDKTVIKFDIWAPVSGRYNEISNMLFTILKKPKGKVELLNSDAEDYLLVLYKQAEKLASPPFYNPFKMLKRMWNIARSVEDEKLIKNIMPIFQGNVARINQISSEIKVIIMMVERLHKSFPVETVANQIDEFKDRLAFIYDFEYGEEKVMKLINKIISLFKNFSSNRQQIIDNLEKLKDHLDEVRNKQTEKYMAAHKINLLSLSYILDKPVKNEIMPFILKAVHADD